MDSLPPETYCLVANCLSISDLNNLTECNRLNHEWDTPLLYRTLRLEFSSGIASSKTLLALQTFSARQHLGGLVRSIDIHHNGKTYSWTMGHSQLLSALLSSIMLALKHITGFSCDCTCVTSTKSFHNLRTLIHKNITSRAELDWIQWHIAKCSQLVSVSRGFPGYNIIPGPLFFDNTLSTHLKGLSRYGFRVSKLKPAQSWNLQRLDINLYSGAHTLIKRLLAMGKLNAIKSLRFAGHLSRKCLSDLVSNLLRRQHVSLGYLNGSHDLPGSFHGSDLMVRSAGSEKPAG